MANKVFNPTDFFTLNDIYLWSAELDRGATDNLDIQVEKPMLQSMREFDVQHCVVTLDDDSESRMLRVLVTLGLRAVRKDDDESVAYRVEATHAVEYFYTELPDDKDLQSFVEFNCVHNVWPFWRQYVYETLKKASLPVPVVPLFSGPKSSNKKKRIRSTAVRTDHLSD